MARNGLDRAQLVAAAAELIELHGSDSFSMCALAEWLGVRPASLYNHIEGLDSLMTEVCAYALRMQHAAVMAAITANGDARIMQLATAYRIFAVEHRELYRLLLSSAARAEKQADDTLRCIVEPFLLVLDHTNLSEEAKLHWQRVLRGIVHGFISEEDAGFFSHLPVNADRSFEIAIQCYMDGLRQAERRANA